MTTIADQYRIIAAGAGWARVQNRGRLRFEGADARTFLQALVSNDLGSLAEGAGTYATYLTPQGRMLADLDIYDRGASLLVGVPGGRQSAALAERFDQLIFAEDVRVADVSADIAEWLVAGGGAAGVLAAAIGVDAPALEALAIRHQLPARGGFVARVDAARRPSFRVIVPASEGPAVEAALEAEGAIEMTDELVEALRVDAGRPLFGIDMTEETIPLEAGLLERGISTEKGCYVGQEVVIRILHRGGGRVARRLARLTIGALSVDPPQAGVPIEHDGREVGKLTSIAPAVDGPGYVALGWVRRDSAEEGRTLTIGGPFATAEAVIAGFAS